MARADEILDVPLVVPETGRALPISGPPFKRPDPALIRQLDKVGAATASAMMNRMGLSHTFVDGPVARTPGSKVVGPVVTLQFMPQREDLVAGLADKHVEKYSALWSVFGTVEPGDILAVQAFGDTKTGTMGEMLVTYFKGRGGIGIVVDGCIRDWPRIQEIGTPMWTRGFTPNYASQGPIFPWAYNVPIACGGVLVLPGDVMIADDDGAVLVPAGMIQTVLDHTLEKEERETFARMRLAEGGELKRYYPLTEENRPEFEEWRKSQAD